MELRKIDIFLLKTLYVVEVGIMAAQVLAMANMTRFLFLLTFPLTVILWARSIRKTVTKTDIIMLIAVALAAVSVLLNASITNSQIGFANLKKLVMFAVSLLFMQTAYRMRSSREVYGFVNTVVDLLILFLIAMYVLQFPRMHMLNGIVTSYLTFRFSNPNLTALFLTCLYMLKIHRLFTREKWYRKLYHVVISVILAWFVVETQARNCLLVLALYTVVAAWLRLRGWNNMRISRGWASFFAWFPALFTALYMSLISAPWVQNMLSFLVSEGKGLDSRTKVWEDALQYLGKSPLIGAYYTASAGTGNFQLHNTHVDIAVSYGVVVLILVCILLTRYLYQNGRTYTDKGQYSYILGFACAICLGIGEAAIFSGGLGIYILVGSFLLLADVKDPETDGAAKV